MTRPHPVVERAARWAARTICTGLWLMALIGTALIVLGVLFASIASAAPVRWSNPGADRYTGTTEAALKRYEGILPAADLAVIRRAALAPASARGWTDLATLTPDGITGGQQYRLTLDHMMFGRDRMAPAVDLASLPPGTRLGARVYCGAGPRCLAWVSICGNPVVLTRIPPDRATPSPVQPDEPSGGGPGLRVPLPPLPWLAPPVPFTVTSPPMPPPPPLLPDEPDAPVAVPVERPGIPAFGLYAPPPSETVVIVVPAPPIPEPSIAALLLAGIGAVAYKARRRA